jgi:hypothetical protein
MAFWLFWSFSSQTCAALKSTLAPLAARDELELPIVDPQELGRPIEPRIEPFQRLQGGERARVELQRQVVGAERRLVIVQLDLGDLGDLQLDPAPLAGSVTISRARCSSVTRSGKAFSRR